MNFLKTVVEVNMYFLFGYILQKLLWHPRTSIRGRQPRRGNDGKWLYPSLAGALNEAGVVRVRTSILRRQNMVVKFIATRPILGLCEVAERRRGTRVPRRWWEQTGIDWKSAREKAAAQGEANEADPGMTGLGLDSEPEPTPGGTAGGTGEEASLGASGSSEAEWSWAEDWANGREL